MKIKSLLTYIILFLSGNNFSQTSDWEWVSTLNGPSSEEEIDAIASDKDANVYISGKFEDTLYISGNNTNLISKGMADIMLIKYNSLGTLVWTKHYGGSGEDNIFDAVCDNNNNLILSGYFEDTLTLGSQTLISQGGLDGFIAKVNPSGNVLWALSYGGIGDEGGNEISVDQNGNIFTCADSDGDLTIGTFSFLNTGIKDSYLIVLDSLGAISWVRVIEGLGTIRGKAIAVDSLGNVLFGGDFSGPINVVDEANNEHTLTEYGAHDAFLTSWTTTGNLNWAKSWGGTGSDLCKGVTTNNQGDIYACGSFENFIDFDNQTLYSLGEKDFFLWKMNNQGNTIWLRQISGVENISGAEIETDGRGGCVFGLGIKGEIILDESNNTTSIIPPPILGTNGSYTVFINYNKTGDIAFTKIADSCYFGIFDELSRSRDQFFLDAPYAGLLNLGNLSITSQNKDAALVSIKLSHLALSITQKEIEEVDFYLYPSLVNEFIIIDLIKTNLDYSKITITDMNGKIIKTIITNQTQTTIDLSYLKAGVYIVNKGKVSHKFIKT